MTDNENFGGNNGYYRHEGNFNHFPPTATSLAYDPFNLA